MCGLPGNVDVRWGGLIEDIPENTELHCGCTAGHVCNNIVDGSSTTTCFAAGCSEFKFSAASRTFSSGRVIYSSVFSVLAMSMYYYL